LQEERLARERRAQKSINGDEKQQLRERRGIKTAVQQGRNERKAGSYSILYGEAVSDARTPLEGLFNSLVTV
jgi:hypothetical protein